jgi:hypothetical protein
MIYGVSPGEKMTCFPTNITIQPVPPDENVPSGAAPSLDHLQTATLMP